VSSQAKIGTRRTDRWAARGGGEGREGYGVRKGYDSWRSREKRRRGRTVVERGWGRARGADKKNEEATRTVEGMPSDERRRAAARARLLSRFQKTLPPCRVFALARYKRETERERERERDPARRCRRRRRRSIVPRRCSPWTDTRASTRLCWFLVMVVR